MQRTSAVIFALILTVLPVNAAIFHVIPEGNNNASGTSLSTAWKSIEYASQQAKAGDRIIVHDGIYNGIIHFSTSGTKDAPISFVAASDQTVILGSFIIDGQAWIEIVGFTIKGPKIFPENWRDMPAVMVDDPSIGLIDPKEDKTARRLKVEQKFKTYIELKDHLQDGYSKGVNIRGGASHITVRGNRISYHTLGIYLTDQSSFILLEDNDIHHCRNGIWSYAKNGISATDVTVRANRSTHHLSFAIEFRDAAQRVLIEDNLCQYNGIGHIAFRRGSAHAIIRNNHVEFGGYYAETMDNPGSSALNLHSLDPGAHILVEGNYAAYQQEPTWDSNGIIIDLSPKVDVIIRDNVFYRNMGAGVTFTKSSLICVYNNTMFENGYQAPGTLSPLNGPGLRFARDSENNNRILNNIFYKNRIAGLYSGGHLDKQIRVDHNLYMAGNQAAAIRDSWDEKRIFSSLNEVKINTAAEGNGSEGAPLFKDPANLDFRLQDYSPALDRGGFLTRTASSGSGTQIKVEDAGYFYAGFGDIPGDQIIVGANPLVHITHIDKANNWLTVDQPLIWDDNTPVNLPFSGKAPDIGAFEFNAPTSVESQTESKPVDNRLEANFPNPFNATTQIRYQLAKAGEVDLSIFDMLGQRILTLVRQHQPAGTYQTSWNGHQATGRVAASGVYFYRLSAPGSVQYRRMTLVK